MITAIKPTTRERWLPRELCAKRAGCSLYVLNKIIRLYDLEVRPNRFDKRSTVVDLYQVKRYLRDVKDI